jgi:hypothetical protein
MTILIAWLSDNLADIIFFTQLIEFKAVHPMIKGGGKPPTY